MIREAFKTPEPEENEIFIMPPYTPSRLLIVMSVISCFLTTLAFAAAFSQMGSVSFFLIPSTAGFLVTTPFYVYLYNYAKRLVEPEQHRKDAGFLSTEALVAGYILITLWLVIFFIDILFCVGTGPGTPVGIILSTIAAGLQWMILIFVALKCTHESWKAEKTAGPVENSGNASGSRPYGNSDEETLTGLPPSVARYIYFVSFVLASLALMFSISLSIACLVNIVAFFATAPHHISMFVASGSPHRSPSPVFPDSKSVVYAFSLVALWSLSVVVDILTADLFQSIPSATFGGLECLITGYIAIRCVVENLVPREGQIHLPAE